MVVALGGIEGGEDFFEGAVDLELALGLQFLEDDGLALGLLHGSDVALAHVIEDLAREAHGAGELVEARGIVPDVMPLAKGLGSGVPIGAVVAGPKAANIFQPGNHGTTFGGNPLAMRAGVETIRIMEEDGLLENAAKVGAHLRAALQRELGSLPQLKEIRGQGLMLGVELTRPCGALVNRAAEAGLLISVTADTVIRLVPPLIMTTAEADELVGILAPLVRQFLAENP